MTAALVVETPAALLSPTLTVVEGNHSGSETLITRVSLAPLIGEIRETYRQRQDIVRAMTSLSNQEFSAYCRLNPDDPKCRVRKKQRESWLVKHCATNPDDPRCRELDVLSMIDAHDPDDTSVTADLAGLSINDIPWRAASHVVSEVKDGNQVCVDAHHRDVPILDLVTLPYREAWKPLATFRKEYEKRLTHMAAQLPVWPWVEDVRGVSALSLAAVVGETGDLWNYPNPAKLWKRMGLAVINGERQRKVTGAAALDHGYAPQRRATLWVIGDCLIKLNQDGPYRTYYLSEKERQRELHPELSDKVTHLRAKRHMEKRFLRDLWRAWREMTPRDAP